jgi:hypothetical protein
MEQAVEHFVWAYQESFRLEIEFGARYLLKELAIGLDPSAFLVPIRVDEAGPELNKGLT